LSRYLLTALRRRPCCSRVDVGPCLPPRQAPPKSRIAGKPMLRAGLAQPMLREGRPIAAGLKSPCRRFDSAPAHQICGKNSGFRRSLVLRAPRLRPRTAATRAASRSSASMGSARNSCFDRLIGEAPSQRLQGSCAARLRKRSSKSGWGHPHPLNDRETPPARNPLIPAAASASAVAVQTRRQPGTRREQEPRRPTLAKGPDSTEI
jgi:hypothetical protein